MTRFAPLDRILSGLPRAYPGPGGAVAVLQNGAVLARHAWGYANAERRIPFTPRTLFRICSITKQFTVATMLEHFPDPTALDPDVRAAMPLLGDAAPRALHLAHNQSGLRDYWAVAMLLGSPAEAPFGDEEARRMIADTRSLHFAPGTRYSYCNQNFRILSDILERRSGKSFADLLRPILARAGMESALLAADTRALPDGAEGYEGSQASGFRAAENRIVWTGDAGLAASLDDMIAWERCIDAARDDPAALPTRLAAPVAFADGAPAAYGFGLARGQEFGRAVLGHGGGLRGWRSQRMYVPAERISVVVLFNHLADAHAAALDVLAAMLGVPRQPTRATLPAPPAWPAGWLGAWHEPETGLAVRIDAPEAGRVRLRFGPGPETLELAPGGAEVPGRTRLRATPDGVWMDRPQDNFSTRLVPVPPAQPGETGGIAGLYRCAELAAELLVVDAGGALYGSFQGPLGSGRMELLEPLGPDLWLLACHRSLDFAPPGDWTLGLHRDASGMVETITLGCWLARGLTYGRVRGG